MYLLSRTCMHIHKSTATEMFIEHHPSEELGTTDLIETQAEHMYNKGNTCCHRMQDRVK